MSGIRLGCAVIATKDGRLILGRRGKEPFFGKWIIPGGGMNRFETVKETAAREFSEETGLSIEIDRVASIAEIISPPDEHRLVIYVEATVIGGELAAGSDLLDVASFSRDEIERLSQTDELTPTVQRTLIQAGWLAPCQDSPSDERSGPTKGSLSLLSAA